MPADEQPHEFVVPVELAELAERLGLPLHAGERVRFVVIDGGLADGESSEPPRSDLLSWVGSIKDSDEGLAENARSIMRAEFGRQ